MKKMDSWENSGAATNRRSTAHQPFWEKMRDSDGKEGYQQHLLFI